ncbi:unnamed protein product, partial [marine sediment metagenome]
ITATVPALAYLIVQPMDKPVHLMGSAVLEVIAEQIQIAIII